MRQIPEQREAADMRTVRVELSKESCLTRWMIIVSGSNFDFQDALRSDP
jgi:hypothetical protein